MSATTHIQREIQAVIASLAPTRRPIWVAEAVRERQRVSARLTRLLARLRKGARR